MTAQEVAERFGVKPATVARWCRAGRFPNARQEETARGLAWRIPETDLDGLSAGGRTEPARGKSPRELQSRKEARRKKEKAQALARWESEGGTSPPLNEQAGKR